MKRLKILIVVTWVASWVANYSTPGECPGEWQQPPRDPYTGQEVISITTDDVMKYCPHKTAMQKEFETEKAARDFMEACPKDVCSEIIIEQVNL